MPNSMTKNKKDEQLIHKMFDLAFPGKEIKQINELTEGFFNVAYAITMTNGSEVILKIAPPPLMDVMTHEINIMSCEVECMKLIASETSVPVAKVFYYDNSHTICDSDYFFMEKLQGESFHSCMKNMSDTEKASIHYRIGELNAVINQIKGSKFGYYGQPDKQGDNWYLIFKEMVKDTYSDAARKSIEIKAPFHHLMDMLDRDIAVFNQVKEPKLVHWDIWAGNVFIHKNEITGIIDFERCLWADELMEVGFRTVWCEQAFLNGYGIGKLSPEQYRRAQWYDIYLFLIMSLEYGYRQYDDIGSYEWSSKMLIESVARIESAIE